MSQDQELVTVRVRDLVVSSNNVRQRPPQTIRELAASIKHHGLLEPLIIEDTPSAPYKVIDGRRRRLALLWLLDNGDITDDHRVLCSVYKGNAPKEASAAANMHEAMHPADEFEAFRDMIDDGSSVEEVAAHFGTTPLTVQRRLKLANVAPTLIEAYRAEEIALDHLMAFAITDDHDAQLRVWKKIKDAAAYHRAPRQIRAALVKADSINVAENKLARFVGLDAYEAAGGPVVRDLFSDGGGFIGDAKLLQKLADEKLASAAATLQAEGWSWVETADSWTYSDETKYGRSQPKKRALSDDEEAELVTLRQRADEIDRLNASADVEDEAMLEELGQVEAKIEAIEASIETFSDRQMAKAGAVVTIANDGTLQIRRGLIKPEKGKKAKNAADDDGAPDDGRPAAPEGPVERALSESLVNKLTAHRTAALQALVASSPGIALALLLRALVPQIFTKCTDYRWRYSGLAKISASDQRGIIQRTADDLENSRAWQSMEASVAHWEDRLPGEDQDLFAWLQTLSQADQLDLLAVCVAHTVDTQAPREDSAVHEHAHQLAEAVDLDMADWWCATAGSYLASVPKTRRMEAVREAVGEDAANTIAGMKKEAMIGAAEEYLDGRRWLPAILRRPGAPATTTDETPPTEPEQDLPATDAASTPTDPADPLGPIVTLAGVRYRDARTGSTWTGRGKRPAWVVHALESGVELHDLLVHPTATEEA
ncbi:ParB N-terminal domain-containing protein [Cupriavidus sp. WS]|uniref:H-NS family nucleoid-associated regulatory protein n=1 Tax=Cupriavidus sp. WS TaxID=1312922 RepID=UPI00036C2AB9|nr:ParB N-terminal domain-containing protein [Cupriavidus sp. WS]